MAVKENTIVAMITRIWEKSETPKYCPQGMEIIKSDGPASPKFVNHVGACGQCSIALEGERAKIQ